MTEDKTTEPTLEEMAQQISDMEKQLSEMRQAYRNKKYAGVRIAMEAKRSAEQALQDELKSLGLPRIHAFGQGSVWW
tara:strand:- start:220 stop:450 length:231 start_codon:yes stop_codon:yes gene_type:complete